MFNKQQRSTFPYWFAHWCAFQMTALNLGVWKIKYLLHDMEKPFMKLFLKDYMKVQKYHRKNNKHHVEHLFKDGKADFKAMMVDWECSRFTKEACQLNAMGEFKRKVKQLLREDKDIRMICKLYHGMRNELMKAKLWDPELDPYNEIVDKVHKELLTGEYKCKHHDKDAFCPFCPTSNMLMDCKYLEKKKG